MMTSLSHTSAGRSVGSAVLAAGDALLKASQGKIKLEAADNTYQQQSSNSSSGQSLGVSVTVGENTGVAFTASASQSQGNINAEGTTYSNTHVSAGNKLTLESGGDTILSGAVVSGKQVEGNIGGQLKIESLQDRNAYTQKQDSSGFAVSLCIPPICYGTSSGSVSMDQTRIASNYQSVGEQSAIRAGDGGFQLDVKGGPVELVGGAITSTQTAIDNKANSLDTHGNDIILSDLTNHTEGSAKTSGMTVDSNMLSGSKYAIARGLISNAMNNAGKSGSATSTTQAGISGIAGNQDARTGDKETGVKPINGEQWAADVQARRAAKNILTEQVLEAGPDAAYQVSQMQELYRIEKTPDGSFKRDEAGQLIMTPLTGEEKNNLQAGEDGKVHIHTNGIFNDLSTAADYATIQADKDNGPLYLAYFPEAKNTFAELLVAGYQKFLEGDFWGLTGTTALLRGYEQQYGATGLVLTGHSRGAMSIGNGTESLSHDPNAASLTNTSMRLFGPAYNAQDLANLLYGLGGSPTGVSMENHKDDFVGVFIGRNPSTGGTTPDGSNPVLEIIRAATGQTETSHNCYERMGAVCQQLWQNGPSTLVVVPANNIKVTPATSGAEP